MSALIDLAVRDAGLDDVLAARGRGAIAAAVVARLRAADLLVLGALADRIRLAEVGDEVRIHVSEPPDGDAPIVVLPSGDGDLTGLDLLREVAMARIIGPSALCVRVDWTGCGLELAQVALGFGANELAGVIATKRGLPIADDALLGVGKKSRRELAQTVKRKELAGCVRRAGRVPVFVGEEMP